MAAIGKKFEENYARYVIREEGGVGYFIGVGEAYRVFLRSHAARFTKKQALEFIDREEEGDKLFLIENATDD
tara:strand:- start:72 stop:287 length:216 start_codon:yes stop_codon:yes gene_type:complete